MDIFSVENIKFYTSQQLDEAKKLGKKIEVDGMVSYCYQNKIYIEEASIGKEEVWAIQKRTLHLE